MPDRKYHNNTINRYDNLRIIDIVSFLAVCECGTFKEAAAKMYITPQGMGYHIRMLERTINVQLFNRSGKHLRLTKAGEELKKYAIGVINLTQTMHDTVARLHAKNSGFVQFAFSHSVSGTEVTGYIEAFKATYPDIEVDMIPVTDMETHRMVREEGYPALTIAPWGPEKLKTFPLRSYPYMLLVNRSHPLAGRDTVTITDLEGHPLILLDEGHMAHQNIVRLCEKAGFQPQKSYIASGAGSAANLARDGQGCAVLMQHVTEAVGLEGVVKIPLDEAITWDVVFMSPEDYEYTQAETLFFTFIGEKCGTAGVWQDRAETTNPESP